MKMKATLVSAVLLGLLAWSMPSFAEVQNVKVSGDITARMFSRENLDLSANNASTLDDQEDFFMSTTGLNVGADLTENVGVFIRLANERDWNVPESTTTASTGDFDLSQAYITLKELFYSPLTVRIGQQPIVWGRGLILGSNLLPGTLLAAGTTDRNAAITADEYTDFTAFDAIRATLDLSNVGGLNLPLTADYVFIKMDENVIGADDDVTIQGVNLSSKFDAWNSEADLYYLLKDDASQGSVAGAQTALKDAKMHTVGIRGSAQPVDGSSVWGELAYQFGSRTTDLEGILAIGGQQSAWAANLGAEYTFADISTTPKAGAEWRFYSGNDVDGAAAGWAAIAPGYFTTAIREFQNRSGGGFYAVRQAGVTSGQTNQHEVALFGGLKPLEDLNVDSRLSWFFLDVGAKAPPVTGNTARNRFVGTEWDTVLKYAYTDDVQFGLLYALFLPGNVFRETPTSGRNSAQQLVTTVSVKF